jgi:hypothetical protein
LTALLAGSGLYLSVGLFSFLGCNTEVLVSLGFFETGSLYVAQAGLELTTLSPQPPECWDYDNIPWCLVIFSCCFKIVIKKENCFLKVMKSF